MRGTGIIVTADPQGTFLEGYIATSNTPKPGTVMQPDLSVALVGGRFTYKVYDADADGGRPKGPLCILYEDFLQGKTYADAYAAGDRCFLYIPKPGDELNMILADVAGTGDDHTKGEILIPKDTTGKLIATTGSPEIEPFQLNETITDPVADTLAWVTYLGY
jgi:hypothetical protein